MVTSSSSVNKHYPVVLPLHVLNQTAHTAKYSNASGARRRSRAVEFGFQTSRTQNFSYRFLDHLVPVRDGGRRWPLWVEDSSGWYEMALIDNPKDARK